jgi:hypothetical protein
MSSLKHGSPVLGVANDGIMAYYKFVVPYPVKVIEIAVIPQSEGDPDLYVKFQNKKSTILPSIDIYDWVSVSYKTDVLIIQADSEVFQNQSNAGEYIIGVLGF